eukprot:scaffold578_cov243-Pinguiococcus_pyrenoidosus.AAC.24
MLVTFTYLRLKHILNTSSQSAPTPHLTRASRLVWSAAALYSPCYPVRHRHTTHPRPGGAEEPKRRLVHGGGRIGSFGFCPSPEFPRRPSRVRESAAGPGSAQVWPYCTTRAPSTFRRQMAIRHCMLESRGTSSMSTRTSDVKPGWSPSLASRHPHAPRPGAPCRTRRPSPFLVYGLVPRRWSGPGLAPSTRSSSRRCVLPARLPRKPESVAEETSASARPARPGPTGTEASLGGSPLDSSAPQERA